LQFNLLAGEGIGVIRIEGEREIVAGKEVVEEPEEEPERKIFEIYKLLFRKGNQILDVLGKIAEPLAETGEDNNMLSLTIQSAQWIEVSNSILITGTPLAIDRVKELIKELDIPLRQVFIEMCIIETTVTDSLSFGVEWAEQHGYCDSPDDNRTRSFGFLPTSFLSGLLHPNPDDYSCLDPDPAGMVGFKGGHLGIIGRLLYKGGEKFTTIGAMIQAIHTDTDSKIVLNPKILTEDNAPATLFVGYETRYQTQSIVTQSNDLVTQSFEYRQVGTTMKVTPQIGNNDIITLDIEQEVNRAIPQTSNGSIDFGNTPTSQINRTTTRVHIPNECFLIVSGLINDDQTYAKSKVPCLGAIPLVGALFSYTRDTDTKRNLMIFIHPKIIDTEDEIEALYQKERGILDRRSCRSMEKVETQAIMEMMNFDPCGKKCADCKEKNLKETIQSRPKLPPAAGCGAKNNRQTVSVGG